MLQVSQLSVFLKTFLTGTRCTECNGELDAFYNFQGFPFCGTCIDVVEERGTISASAGSSSAGPKITNAFSNKPSDNVAPSTHSSSPPPPSGLPTAGSSFSSSFSGLPPAPSSSSSWQDRALLAEEQVVFVSFRSLVFANEFDQVRQLYEKLAMVKVALAEERRISAEEYTVLQQELEEEKKRRELLEKMRQQRSLVFRIFVYFWGFFFSEKFFKCCGIEQRGGCKFKAKSSRS